MKKIKRKVNQKQLLLIALCLVVILVGMIILFKVRNNHPKDNLVYQEFDMIGGAIDKDRYYLFGAKKDISFKIETLDNFSYEITDDDNNKVIVKHNKEDDIITILAPENLYSEGKTYALKIQNGKFMDSMYGDAKEIIFSIIRPSKQDAILKDNLVHVDIKDVTVDDNIIKINGNYKENDIILGYDHDNLKAAYKIVKKSNNNSYEYTIPEMNEIFNEIDYYGMQKINLANYANNKDFNAFLVSSIRKALLDSLIDTVYAKEDVTISKPVWNKKDYSLEIGITIDSPNKENFLANHNTKIELTMIISIDLYHNITDNNYGYILVLNYNTNINHGLNPVDNNFVNFYDDIKDKEVLNDYETKWLEENYSNLNNDKINLNKKIGNILVNTNVPGLDLVIDTGIIFNNNSKAFIDSSLASQNQLVIGINNELGLFHSYQTSNTGTGNFVGDVDNLLGGIINVDLSFLNISNLNIETTSGIYTEGKSTITVDKKDDKMKEVRFGVEGKINNYQTCLVQFNNSEKKTIVENKEELNKYSRNVKITGKKEKEEEKDNIVNNQVNYKYSADEVKELLQQAYDDLASNGEWNVAPSTMLFDFTVNKSIDINSNQFMGVWNYNSGAASFTCTYDYVTDETSCNNFEGAQNYIKGICNNLYNDYLKYQETGESEIEGASEWEEIYGELDACYYEAIPRTEPTELKDDFKTILDKANLSRDDLGVLAN